LAMASAPLLVRLSGAYFRCHQQLFHRFPIGGGSYAYGRSAYRAHQAGNKMNSAGKVQRRHHFLKTAKLVRINCVHG